MGVTTSPLRCWRVWKTWRRRRGRQSTSRRLTAGSPPARTQWLAFHFRRTPWPLQFSSFNDSSPVPLLPSHTLYYPLSSLLYPDPLYSCQTVLSQTKHERQAASGRGNVRKSPSSSWTTATLVIPSYNCTYILFLACYSFLVVQLYIFNGIFYFKCQCVINNRIYKWLMRPLSTQQENLLFILCKLGSFASLGNA